MPTTILFADPDHGPRAQLAAALLRSIDEAGSFEVSSAGISPGGDLTAVAEVLVERGLSFIPSSQQLELSMAPDLLIVVCEEGCAACPYLPRAARTIRWPFDDPSELPTDRRADALRALAASLESLCTKQLTQGGCRLGVLMAIDVCSAMYVETIYRSVSTHFGCDAWLNELRGRKSRDVENHSCSNAERLAVLPGYVATP